jgi:tetratricopeptide (TPR) repeat protein
MLGHENIHNVLQTPKEMLVLQRTIKGVLDWQQHAENSAVDLDDYWAFYKLLRDTQQCLFLTDSNPFACEKITLSLRRTSAKIQSHMMTCTPLAVLHSVELLLCFAHQRDSSRWYSETSRFIINTAVEAFPDSHPSLLLLRLLFSDLTPSQLVMMYEVGSNVIEQCHGEAESFLFRGAMHRAAYGIGLSSTIRSYADAICAATHDATDSGRLFDIASLYYSTGQWEKSADALEKCLSQLEDEGDKATSSSRNALHLLAFVKFQQEDFLGEAITVQKLLKLLEATVARDRGELDTSQLDIEALQAISWLDDIYRHHDLREQRDALHLEYPSAFEL